MTLSSVCEIRWDKRIKKQLKSVSAGTTVFMTQMTLLNLA